SFFGTLIVVGVDADQAVRGLLPGFPDTEAIFLGLGMAATTFPVVAAVYQTYLMREKQWGVENLLDESHESFLGILILGTIATVILLTSAGAIHGVTDPVFSAQGMALQLEPLAGPAAFYLFTIGFFFASLSSMIVNPLIGATLLVDGFGYDASINGRPVKIWTAFALTIGLAVVLIFRESPIEILRVAQAMTVIAFPILGFLVLAIASDSEVMHEYKNSFRTNLLGALGYLTILGIVFNYLRSVINTLH
ncbi:MAG TPA: divalent metal cation transporter, partial [bacterium]|nr:divalent metal cation transporter [bacterium]